MAEPTVLDVGAHLIRQRGVPCAEPAFIEAYLVAEVARFWSDVEVERSNGRIVLVWRAPETPTPPTPFAHRAGSERAS